MNDFFEWVFHPRRPVYITIMASILIVMLLTALAIVCVVLFVTGYWVVPVALFILLPAYVVIKAYLESKHD